MDSFKNDWELFGFLTKYLEGGYVTYVSDSQPFFAKILELYPITFYRIDWDKLPHWKESISGQYPENKKELCKSVSRIFQDSSIDEGTEVYVCFDGYVKGALKMNLKLFIEFADEILSYPQHTYVIPEDASWCLNYSMESTLSFGYHK